VDSSARTTSIWLATAETPAAAPLDADMTADVCVIGAGIAGMTTAYLLAREGRGVVVLDDGAIGSGETGRTTAHLSNEIDDRYVEIERLHGRDGARAAAESHSAAIDRIEAIVADERIECDFRRLDGYLFTAPGQPPSLLDEELDAAHRAGLTAVERVPRVPVEGFDNSPALRFPRQAQFHPLRYLDGLARAIGRMGSQIFTKTHASPIEPGEPVRVTTSRGPTVTASAVVVATNTPINYRVALHTKQAAYRSYVIGVRVPAGVVPPALYWDTADPYHYVRLSRGTEPGGEVLIVGGEDHKTGQADDADERYARLEMWTRAHFARAGGVEFRWSGQVMESIDGLAFIGRDKGTPSVYVVTGDSGMGMTHGTIAGILLTDLIVGRENPWASLYDPGRVPLRAAGEFAKENLNVATQYADWITGGDVESLDQIVPGEGAVVRRGLMKLAVYRDGKGVLHLRSAVCPHLGCIVSWNSKEQSWDCPCHGSRFNAYGRVVNGPANSDLAPVDE